MGEYLIDISDMKKIKVTRCGHCSMSEETEVPNMRFCTFWKKNVPYGGFCYLGAEDEKTVH